jgi:hypothetical protein
VPHSEFHNAPTVCSANQQEDKMQVLVLIVRIDYTEHAISNELESVLKKAAVASSDLLY